MSIKASLFLNDGSKFTGLLFGSSQDVDGEIVFQTGMVGYPQSLTDPSYHKQVLVLTYPLIGNYGIPAEEDDEFGLSKWFESHKIHVAALIVSECCTDPSHWSSVRSLSAWLKKHQVPAIHGINTRTLTKKIRSQGTMLCKIRVGEEAQIYSQFDDPNLLHLVDYVSTKKISVYNENGKFHVVAVDCGIKHNQIRCLCKRGAKVTVVPWNYDFDQLEFDGLFLSNGPGDPMMCRETIAHIKEFLNRRPALPLFGICLGHQLLSLALEAPSFKMKFGNRGHNQPCLLSGTQRCFITSQNHGFAIDADRLPPGWSPLFVNANDQTNEGIVHDALPFISCQFHPEHTPGPCDLEPIFDVFVEAIKLNKDPRNTSLPPVKELLCTCLGVQPTLKPNHFLRIPKKVLILGSGV